MVLDKGHLNESKVGMREITCQWDGKMEGTHLVVIVG